MAYKTVNKIKVGNRSDGPVPRHGPEHYGRIGHGIGEGLQDPILWDWVGGRKMLKLIFSSWSVPFCTASHLSLWLSIHI